MARLLGCLALLGVVTASPLARADEWIGSRVFRKHSARPRVGTKSVDPTLIPVPATVTAVDGEWLWLGRAWVRKSEVMTAEQALDHWTEEIRKQPSWAYAYGNRATVWADKGELDNALADYTEALRLNPRDPHVWSNRGGVWAMKGETENAIKDVSESIRVDPSHAMAYTNRGLLHTDAGDFASAIKDCTEAMRLDPGQTLAYLARAEARFQAGDYERAVADIESARRLDATCTVAMTSLARLRSTCPDPAFRDAAEALELARRAGDLQEWKHVANFTTLAAAQAEAGDFPAAVEAQEKAVALMPGQVFLAKRRREVTARLELYKAGRPYRDEPGIEEP